MILNSYIMIFLRLAIVLEINLELLLTAVGYADILDSFKAHNRTPKNLKELVRQYREFQIVLL